MRSIARDEVQGVQFWVHPEMSRRRLRRLSATDVWISDQHYMFSSERYGAGGDDFKTVVYDIDPTRPIGSFKKSWEAAKVSLRFHDLRHTCVTRMLEGGVPLSVVASILGWSPATTARMAKRYGHIGEVAQRQAVAVLNPKKERKARPRKPPASVEHVSRPPLIN